MLLPPHLFCVFRYIRPRAAPHEPSVKKRLNRPRRLFIRTRPFAPYGFFVSPPES